MNSKGFTLIELLAVIVILAIIALIATPIVLGIINDSKESANRVSATYIVDAVEQSYGMVYALNSGAIPTIEQVRGRFNVENAVWAPGSNQIKTLDGMVTCDVRIENNEFSVACSHFNIETITMAIVETQ